MTEPPADAGLVNAVAFLRAGDWAGAHAIVQEDTSPTACWAHGIVHVLEGDVGNARYWYGRARRPFPQPYDAGAEIDALANAIEGAGEGPGSEGRARVIR